MNKEKKEKMVKYMACRLRGHILFNDPVKSGTGCFTCMINNAVQSKVKRLENERAK